MTSDPTDVQGCEIATRATERSGAALGGGSTPHDDVSGGVLEPLSLSFGFLSESRAYYYTGTENPPTHWPIHIPLPDVSQLPLGASFKLRGDDRVIARIFVSYASVEAGASEAPAQGQVFVSYAAVEAGANEARTRQLVGRKIDQIWALQDGWRGPDSLAPSQIARELYLASVQVLPGRCLAAAQPTPTADGGLHMEWTRGQYDFSADITSDGQLILNVFAPNQNEDTEEVIQRPTRDNLVDFICRGV